MIIKQNSSQITLAKKYVKKIQINTPTGYKNILKTKNNNKIHIKHEKNK